MPVIAPEEVIEVSGMPGANGLPFKSPPAVLVNVKLPSAKLISKPSRSEYVKVLFEPFPAPSVKDTCAKSASLIFAEALPALFRAKLRMPPDNVLPTC